MCRTTERVPNPKFLEGWKSWEHHNLRASCKQEKESFAQEICLLAVEMNDKLAGRRFVIPLLVMFDSHYFAKLDVIKELIWAPFPSVLFTNKGKRRNSSEPLRTCGWFERPNAIVVFQTRRKQPLDKQRQFVVPLGQEVNLAGIKTPHGEDQEGVLEL